jgi:hypothetical protein
MARYNRETEYWECESCERNFVVEHDADDCDCEADNEWCDDNGSIGDPEDNND